MHLSLLMSLLRTFSTGCSVSEMHYDAAEKATLISALLSETVSKFKMLPRLVALIAASFFTKSIQQY
jgi:hypothetical protein